DGIVAAAGPDGVVALGDAVSGIDVVGVVRSRDVGHGHGILCWRSRLVDAASVRAGSREVGLGAGGLSGASDEDDVLRDVDGAEHGDVLGYDAIGRVDLV